MPGGQSVTDLLDPPDIGAGVLAASPRPGRLSMLLMAVLNAGCAGWFAFNVSASLAMAWFVVATVGQIFYIATPMPVPAPDDREAVRRALRRHLALVSALAAAHGSIGFFIFAPGNPAALALLGMTVYGMAVAFSMFVSQYKRALQAAIALLMAPAFLMAMFHPQRTSSFFGAVGLAFMVFMLRFVTVRADQFAELVRLRIVDAQRSVVSQDALQRLEQTQAERLRFFSAANHDLRQPVMAIGLQAEVLQHQLDAQSSSPEVRRTVAALLQAQQALEALTNQLLEIGRIEAAADPLHPVAVALFPLLQGLAQQSPRIRVRCPVDAWVWTDALALQRVLANLIDNALKFAPHGRVLIAVRGRRAGTAWRLEVRDNGIGIAPEAQPRVFEDFEQLGNAERNLQRGHGLGLSIVRRLLARLGTEVTLRSAAGQGAVFAFEMNAMPAAGAAVATPAESPASPTTLPREAGVIPGLSVLVVEDNAVVADSIVALLREWKVQPQLYAEASEALALADLRSLDVALCDIRLPGPIDGMALAHLLQKQNPDLVIALVSADISPAVEAVARRQGWHALRKPVLAEALRAVLSGARQHSAKP
ncbi:MAG: hybrid sensor histidine kinase/response regulator [Comamonadaceae bacterium]|nr:MAG: hybrid sensor histidine kinase/response regulator [Comamonadaceae bacterium]